MEMDPSFQYVNCCLAVLSYIIPNQCQPASGSLLFHSVTNKQMKYILTSGSEHTHTRQRNFQLHFIYVDIRSTYAQLGIIDIHTTESTRLAHLHSPHGLI